MPTSRKEEFDPEGPEKKAKTGEEGEGGDFPEAGSIRVWVKIKPPGYDMDPGFGPWFHLPGFHFGVTLFLTHSQNNIGANGNELIRGLKE